MWPNVSVQQFLESLNEINIYLLLFLEEFSMQLNKDEMIEIIYQACSYDFGKY
jgi:hypothetical protein